MDNHEKKSENPKDDTQGDQRQAGRISIDFQKQNGFFPFIPANLVDSTIPKDTKASESKQDKLNKDSKADIDSFALNYSPEESKKKKKSKNKGKADAPKIPSIITPVIPVDEPKMVVTKKDEEDMSMKKYTKQMIGNVMSEIHNLKASIASLNTDKSLTSMRKEISAQSQKLAYIDQKFDTLIASISNISKSIEGLSDTVSKQQEQINELLSICQGNEAKKSDSDSVPEAHGEEQNKGEPLVFFLIQSKLFSNNKQQIDENVQAKDIISQCYTYKLTYAKLVELYQKLKLDASIIKFEITDPKSRQELLGKLRLQMTSWASNGSKISEIDFKTLMFYLWLLRIERYEPGNVKKEIFDKLKQIYDKSEDSSQKRIITEYIAKLTN